MTDLAEFILARLAEREAAAQAELDEPALNEYDPDTYNSPAWVLADVAAKRAIVEGCQETLAKEDSWDPQLEGGDGEEFELARFVLRQLAQPFADHPGFDPAWRVEP